MKTPEAEGLLLTTREREVLAILESQGWSLQQVGEHLGIGNSTVEAHLRHICDKLKIGEGPGRTRRLAYAVGRVRGRAEVSTDS